MSDEASYVELQPVREGQPKPRGWFWWLAPGPMPWGVDKMDLRPRHNFIEWFIGLGPLVLVMGYNGD